MEGDIEFLQNAEGRQIEGSDDACDVVAGNGLKRQLSFAFFPNMVQLGLNCFELSVQFGDE